jgi:hypothetical protein
MGTLDDDPICGPILARVRADGADRIVAICEIDLEDPDCPDSKRANITAELDEISARYGLPENARLLALIAEIGRDWFGHPRRDLAASAYRRIAAQGRAQ